MDYYVGNAVYDYLIENKIYKKTLQKRINVLFFTIKYNVESAYESYYYFKGDYTKAYQYAYSLVEKYKDGGTKKNADYNLVMNNCMQVSKRVLGYSNIMFSSGYNYYFVNYYGIFIPSKGNAISNTIPNSSPFHIWGKTR